jgi:hypothetical protein
MSVEHIDHVEYPERLKSFSASQLWETARDAYEAEKVNPNGPKSGYYLDEINYVSNELNRRGIGLICRP